MWSRYIMWRGNFMLNWAINRPITGKTSNHRFWPVDTGLIDIANTADIERLLYAQNGMWRCLVHGQIGRRCYYGGYTRVAFVGQCKNGVIPVLLVLAERRWNLFKMGGTVNSRFILKFCVPLVDECFLQYRSSGTATCVSKIEQSASCRVLFY